ncbi:unnamed protein product [Orchesella dallaii]|uniref:Uncharacterized protein n=1 Tax=Orchesella dallaii TaxID=48710 RepID=A0ABP1RBX6_9HEXA
MKSSNNKLPSSQAPCELYQEEDGRSCRNINLESTFGGSNNNSSRQQQQRSIISILPATTNTNNNTTSVRKPQVLCSCWMCGGLERENNYQAFRKTKSILQLINQPQF